MARGGKRPGAGRPRAYATRLSLSLSPAMVEAVKRLRLRPHERLQDVIRRVIEQAAEATP